MLDLSNYDTAAASDEGAVMEVIHPGTGDVIRDPETGEAMTLTLLGVDSTAYQQAFRKNMNRRLNAKAKGQDKMTAEQLESEAIERLVLCTKGWTHVGLDGEVLDCTEANARLVYTRFPWLRMQADEFIADRANFLSVSSQSSSSSASTKSRSTK